MDFIFEISTGLNETIDEVFGTTSTILEQLDTSIRGFDELMDKIDDKMIQNLLFHFNPDVRDEYINRIKAISRALPLPLDIKRIILEYAGFRLKYKALVDVNIL